MRRTATRQHRSHIHTRYIRRRKVEVEQVSFRQIYALVCVRTPHTYDDKWWFQFVCKIFGISLNFFFVFGICSHDGHAYWHTPAAMNVSRRKKKKQNEMREKITESTHTRLLLSKAPLRRTHFSLQANCIQCGAVRSDYAIAQNKNMYTQRDGRPSAAMNRRSNTVCVLRLLHLRHSFYLSCQRFGWKITRGYSYKRRQECIKCRTRLINTQVTTCIVVDRQKT